MTEPRPFSFREEAELALTEVNVSFETVLDAVGLAIYALCEVSKEAERRGQLTLSAQALSGAEGVLAKLRPLVKEDG